MIATENIVVEQYTEQHYDDLIRLLRAFHKESLEDYGFEFDIKELQKLMDAGRHAGFVLLIDGKCQGILAGQIIRPGLCSFVVYQESIWFVDKEYRKYGLRLYAFAEKWAKDYGCTKFVMVCMHNSQTEKLFRFYGRMGFRPCETHFIKEL